MENNNNSNNKTKLGGLSIALICVAGILLIAGVILTVRQFVLIPGAYTPPPSAAPDAQAGTVVVMQPDGEFISEDAAPVTVDYERKIPVKIYFTTRSVMADIEPVGIIMEGDRTGKMGTINDALVAAWYEDGPAPGEAGNALINGHVRWKGKAGTFSVLPDMKVGEEIVIEFEDASTLAFTVSEINFYPFNEVPTDAMALDWGGSPRMTLISCTGDFNSVAGTSSMRVFVVAEPVY